jgi:hypothetical protein
MAISNKEKDRRGAKKLYEKVDTFFDDVMEDSDFIEQTVKAWATADPKGFMTLLEKRLPKVQPVDQDLQRMTLGLKDLLGELPDFDDIALELKKANKKIKDLEVALCNMTEEKEHWRKKCLKERKKNE